MYRLSLVLVGAIFCLVGCGGSSGGHNSLLATNGSSGGGGGLAPTGPAANVAAITVEAGPANAVNAVFVSLTICTPGNSSQCQTVDHILVDTGSSGVRIIASALTGVAVLSADNDVASSNPIVECTQFADGFSWGPVKRADVLLSGETASNIAVQIIGDPNFTVVPSDCTATGTEEDTVNAFGANGIIGVSSIVADCGGNCAVNPPLQNFYYSCNGAACTPLSLPTAQQVSNPVAFFSVDNNGVIVELPSISASGVASVSGSLVFGIDTQSNNALGNARVFAVDPVNGFFTTKYKNVSYDESFIDSGSNGFFFNDNSIALCSSSGSAPDFYCPTSTLTLSATNSDSQGASGSVNFNVANAETLFANPTAYAFSNLGGPSFDSRVFDWGLPFFYGRHVFTAIIGKSTSGGLGPYVAY